jgi:hypothetical protein
VVLDSVVLLLSLVVGALAVLAMLLLGLRRRRLIFVPLLVLFLGFVVFYQLLNIFGCQLFICRVGLLRHPRVYQRLLYVDLLVDRLTCGLCGLILVRHRHFELFAFVSIDHGLLLGPALDVVEALKLSF